MNDNAQKLINLAVEDILSKMSNDVTIKKLDKKHSEKIHFIPKSYRVFGGILQSMNIQFGNFIEKLMELLIRNDGRYEIIEKYSGKKSNAFLLSRNNDRMIDFYISQCQLEPEGFCYSQFSILQESIIQDNDPALDTFKHDIDLLFRDKISGRYYYLEIKYNDDHDTGKFIDINRKFIKTYAYLVRELGVLRVEDLTPILFFFNNKRMKGNLYIPENTNIRRGANFFDEFITDVKYTDLSNFMSSLSESRQVKEMFDKLYIKVRQS